MSIHDQSKMACTNKNFSSAVVRHMLKLKNTNFWQITKWGYLEIKNGLGQVDIELSLLLNKIKDGLIPMSGPRPCNRILFKELNYD